MPSCVKNFKIDMCLFLGLWGIKFLVDLTFIFLELTEKGFINSSRITLNSPFIIYLNIFRYEFESMQDALTNID